MEDHMIMRDIYRLRDATVSALFFALVVVSVAICCDLAGTEARAQSTSTGTVSGQVKDAQSAAVPGAEVKLLDPSTNTSRTTITNEEGRYAFVNVPPGIYNMLVSK